MPKVKRSGWTTRRWQGLIVAVCCATILQAGAARAATTPVRVLETGSTLLYPLFNIWVPDYMKTHPGVQITTQGTGSGTGIAQASSGIAQIGASDAYMSSAQLKRSPGILNIPLAISSQMVNYNLPGFNHKHLKLSGPVIAGIYSGKIRYWDDAALKSMNPDMKLPHKAIIPVHRSDGSGDTFIFTQFLAFSTPSWANGTGYGTSVSWPPVEGEIGGVGNPGMISALKGSPYSLAYVGISYKKAIEADGLGEAMLQNRDGHFVLANAKTVGAAVLATAAKTPKDERISLIFAPGAESYPIINYEYAIVNKKQPSPEMAKALRELLAWSIHPDGGSAQKYMDAVGFVPLPAPIRSLSAEQIALIK